MATSGSYDWAASRTQVVKDALQRVGGLGLGETPSADQTTQAVFLLNAVVKHWHTQGMPLWKLGQGFLLPQTGDSSFSLSSTGDYCTNSYVHTTTSTTSSSGGSTITVDSATGISNSYYIGVELSDGTMQWTTVNGSPVGSVVTLTATLSGDVSSGADIYVFQNKIQAPKRIQAAWRRTHAGDDIYDIPMILAERENFFDLSNRTSASYPTHWYYQPQRVSGEFHVYPRFSNGDCVVMFSYQIPFEDMDGDSDDFDFPAEWILPLTWELSYQLAAHYGIPPDERKAWKMEAKALKQEALDYDQEEGSIYLMPSEEHGRK